MDSGTRELRPLVLPQLVAAANPLFSALFFPFLDEWEGQAEAEAVSYHFQSIARGFYVM